jgi:hypothetical protein
LDIDSGKRVSGKVNGPDMGGDIKVLIADGTYNEDLRIKRPGYNKPSKFKLWFQSKSNDSSKVTINSPKGSSFLTGNLTLKHLTFKTKGCSFENNNNTIQSCVFLATSIKDDHLVYIVGVVKNIAISNCYFKNAIAGVGIRNNSSHDNSEYNYNDSMTFTNCLFDSVSYGIRDYGGGTAGARSKFYNISKNITTHKDKFNKLITGGGIILELDSIVSITHNRINLHSKGVGIRIQAASVEITNNFISVLDSHASEAIYIRSYNELSIIYNNTILLKNIFQRHVGIYSETFKNLRVKNNLIKSVGDSNIAFIFTYLNFKDSLKRKPYYTSDYNVFNDSTKFWGKFQNQTQRNLSTWQSNYQLDSHSFIASPVFVSETDLHTTSQSVFQKGIPLKEVTVDIDGEPRDSLHPCIGADEFTAFTVMELQTSSEKDEIRLYPNPATNVINLSIPSHLLNSRYVIYECQGKQVMQGGINNKSIEIPTLKLITGFYFVKVGNVIKSFVKE